MQNKTLLISAILVVLTCSPIALADTIVVRYADTVWNLALDSATDVDPLVGEPGVMEVKYADTFTYRLLENATDVNRLVGEPGVMVVRYADAITYKPLENATEVGRLVGEPDAMVVKYADAFTYQPLENATSVGRLAGEPGVMVVKYADAISYQPLENATDVGRLTGEPDMIVVKYADSVWELDLVKEDYLPNQTHDLPWIELTALTSIKTVDNINASYSIGIFNGQNDESTFDLTVLNHDTAAVAALNQSTICIPPWESREVTLNVTDETPGEYAVSVRATSRNNSDITGEVTTRTIVQESFNINMMSLEGTKTSIDANITYLLTIRNNQKNKDTLTLNSSGIDPSWISFDTVHQLGSGEQKTIPIKMSIPGSASAGSFTLIVSATSSNLGTIRNASLPLVVQNGPIISGLVPLNNSYIGSDDVIFAWVTNINSTTQAILNQSGIETTYAGDEGICHSVVVENLTRNQWYTYRVISNTSYGSTESEERSFYIDNGVTFTERIYDFNIERDYDQRVTVTVRNTDSIAHEILLNVNSTNLELIAGFIGEGSIDEIITLAPDETKDVILALHAQDAAQRDYYLSLNLTTDDNISDNAIANIHVRLPNIDLRFEELSIDPLTLTKTIRLTNHGDTVTDLNIYGNGGLKGNVTFQPTISHGYLGGGRSVTFEAKPVLTLDFTGMNGTIVAEAAGVKTNLTVNYTLPEGMDVYFGTVPNVTVEFSDYFDNDDSPNTNPKEDALVESYLTNGSLIFFSQIIVDVFQDGESVSNANVTLKTWDSNGKTLILNGVSDFYGKALFAIFGKADNYSYKAIVDNYKVETETRNFSVDNLNPLYHVYPNNITWLNISDSNSTFTNFSESIVLDDAPYSFKATKSVLEDNETFILDLRWKLDHQKQVTIPGSTEGTNLTFNTSGIPVGNYTATIVSLVNKSLSLSETINITVTDVNGMSKQKNFTFWVPFPVNKTHMTTLNIEHRVLSEDPKIVFDLNNVGTNNYNKSEYLFEYSILSNETKIENVSISVVTPRGTMYSNVNSISLEANIPSFINITVPVNYTDGARIEEFNISTSTNESEIYINVTPEIHYIYEKRIWVGAERGVVDLWEDKDVLISCGTGMAWAGAKQVIGFKHGKDVAYVVGHFYNVYQLSGNIVDKDLAGVVETTGSEIIALQGLMKYSLSGESEVSYTGLAWSTWWCMKKWYDVGVEAGIYNDIRDIGIYSYYKLWNWYCTNRPTVWSYFILPSTIPQSMSPTPNIEDGYIVMRFTLPWSEGSYYPHDVDVYLNGVEIGNLSNTIPEGHYIVRFDPSILNYADSGTSTNIVTLRTKHLNGGHFVVAADMQIILPMKRAEMYVVTSNQSEANRIINEMSSVMRNKADFGIYPEDIKFSNPVPPAGENIAIHTTIFNFGTNGALFVPLQFFDNGAQIGENVTVGYIPPLDSIPVNITWNPSQGTHTITVKINPDKTIYELDYANNEASKNIFVQGASDTEKPVIISATAKPIMIVADGIDASLLNVTATDKVGVTGVTVNLSAIGWSQTQPMSYSDGVWQYETTAAPGTPSGTYYLRVTASDAAGNYNDSVSIELNVTKDVIAPIITNITATDITSASATITWDTDEPSDSLVKYGTECGNCTLQKSNPANVTSHSATLTGLLPNTTYYFAANSTDQSGNSNQSAEYNFTTSIKGDLNHDGTLTSADAVIVLGMAARGEYNPIADVNDDKRVTSLDALMIMQAAAGNIKW